MYDDQLKGVAGELVKLSFYIRISGSEVIMDHSCRFGPLEIVTLVLNTESMTFSCFDTP